MFTLVCSQEIASWVCRVNYLELINYTDPAKIVAVTTRAMPIHKGDKESCQAWYTKILKAVMTYPKPCVEIKQEEGEYTIVRVYNGSDPSIDELNARMLAL